MLHSWTATNPSPALPLIKLITHPSFFCLQKKKKTPTGKNSSQDKSINGERRLSSHFRTLIGRFSNMLQTQTLMNTQTVTDYIGICTENTVQKSIKSFTNQECLVNTDDRAKLKAWTSVYNLQRAIRTAKRGYRDKVVSDRNNSFWPQLHVEWFALYHSLQR